MANKFRGEVDLEFTREQGDKEVPAKFRLVFDVNAFCEIEEETKLSMGELLEAMSDNKKMSFKRVRALVHGGLLRHHPDLTLADAGDIVSDYGLPETVAALNAAVAGAMKDKSPGEGKRGKAKVT